MVQGPPTSGLQQPVGYHRAIPLDEQWLSFSGAPLAARLPQRLGRLARSLRSGGT